MTYITGINLTVMMNDLQTWSQENFGDNKGIKHLGPLIGMQEELGELAHIALTKHQDIRTEEGFDRPDELGILPEHDALADILVYWLDYCWRIGIQDPEALVEKVLYQRVLKRDWNEHRKLQETDQPNK